MTIAAAAFAAICAFAEPETKTDGELWNEGVDFYRAGDFTNALRVLRPLTLSRTHRARAAEVVAKIEYDASRDPAAADPLPHLEEAAVAAQIALHDNPDDPRANANFTRATDALPAMRETKRVNAAIAAAKNKDPAATVREGMAASRRLLAALDAPATNGPAAAIARADAAAAKAESFADAWIGLKEPLVQAAATNEDAAARISATIDSMRKKSSEAATLLGDMDRDARYPLAELEQSFTAFHKALAMPPEAIRVDLACQSNSWIDATEECGRNWQSEALDYTRSFRSKFPAWAQEYERRAQSDTNLPPFTAEAQAEISALSERLETLQSECVPTPLPPKQEESLQIIRRIIELMPPEKGGGGQSQQQQNKQQDKNKDDKSDGAPQDGESGENNEDEQNGDDAQNQENENEEENEKDESGGEEKDDAGERELEAVLMKAQERSDEHEAEKKARMRGAKLPPNERDW